MMKTRSEIRKIIAVIEHAYRTLTDPHKWIQGTFACDAAGDQSSQYSQTWDPITSTYTYTVNSTASCFCATGALLDGALTVNKGNVPQAQALYRAANHAVDLVVRRKYHLSLISVNDARTEDKNNYTLADGFICNPGNETARQQVLSAFTDTINELKEELS